MRRRKSCARWWSSCARPSAFAARRQDPKGVLLVGAPGTGKTLLARAVAGEAKVPFFQHERARSSSSCSSASGPPGYVTCSNRPSRKPPASCSSTNSMPWAKSRSINPLGTHDEREQTLNQLLVEMDGFDPNVGVIIMAATNRPEILDAALLRAGRFDRHVALDRPDVRGREAILRVHTRQVKLATDVDLRVVASRTPGFVGADLANAVNEAALLAARRERTEVTMQDFDDAIDRITVGAERKTRVMNKREREIVAYHESGHALMRPSSPTWIRSEDVHHPPWDRRLGLHPAAAHPGPLPDDAVGVGRPHGVLLGGRVAEEIVFGDISTGAQDDLQKATDIALSMVTQYGMSDTLGLRTFRARTALPVSRYARDVAQGVQRREIQRHRQRGRRDFPAQSRARPPSAQ